MEHARIRLPLLFFALVGTAVFIVVILSVFPWPSMSVTAVSVSAFNVSSSSISGVWDISFDLRNTKVQHLFMITFSYEDVHASVYYNLTKLAQTDLAPFHHGASKRTITLKTTLAASGVYVDPSIINTLKAERAAGGSVDFTVEFLARVRRKGANKPRPTDAKCRQISLALPENFTSGIFIGGSRKCIIDDS